MQKQEMRYLKLAALLVFITEMICIRRWQINSVIGHANYNSLSQL